MKTLLNIIGGIAILGTICAVVYLDEKINDLDDAVYQHMKDEYNEKVMKNACHAS